jgi:hypothetical protein
MCGGTCRSEANIWDDSSTALFQIVVSTIIREIICMCMYIYVCLYHTMCMILAYAVYNDLQTWSQRNLDILEE